MRLRHRRTRTLAAALLSLPMITVTTCSQAEVETQMRDGITIAMNELAIAVTTDAAYAVLGYYDN